MVIRTALFVAAVVLTVGALGASAQETTGPKSFRIPFIDCRDPNKDIPECAKARSIEIRPEPQCIDGESRNCARKVTDADRHVEACGLEVHDPRQQQIGGYLVHEDGREVPIQVRNWSYVPLADGSIRFDGNESEYRPIQLCLQRRFPTRSGGNDVVLCERFYL